MCVSIGSSYNNNQLEIVSFVIKLYFIIFRMRDKFLNQNLANIFARPTTKITATCWNHFSPLLNALTFISKCWAFLFTWNIARAYANNVNFYWFIVQCVDGERLVSALYAKTYVEIAFVVVFYIELLALNRKNIMN